MKHFYLLCYFLIQLCTINQLSASNVSRGLIEQPINLVANSDPASIPLGAVVYSANYNYGIHQIITAPRPCLHGAMEWDGGSELNQNLASAFGILVEPEDPTSVPSAPVNIRIKAWKKPSYSPYSKEQVLAATLHCLLRSTYSTPEHPLTIKILAEDPKDLDWAKKYQKEYINQPASDNLPISPTRIPNTTLTTNQQGLTSVNFTGIAPKPSTHKPIMIASRMGGADGEDNSCALIPVWFGTTVEQPLSEASKKCGLYHDLFPSSHNNDADANLLANQADPVRWHYDPKDNSLSVAVGDIAEQDLAATLYAITLSAQAHSDKPLTVQLSHFSGGIETLTSFTSSKGWKKTGNKNHRSLECELAIDLTTGKLSTGSLPLIEKVARPADRPIRIITTE